MAISRDIGLGRAFWRQSLADAEEARILLSNGRIASALVSCQHAIEKALKAVLFVEIGENNFQLRHNMSVELGKSIRLQLPLRDMNSLQALEDILPLGGVAGKTRRNTEYPWSTTLLSTRVYHPHAMFRSRLQAQRFLALYDRIQFRVRNAFPELS
jgi:hypothetical protein